jgi:hypothetical protein
MATPSIPASAIVNILPNVIGAGGSGLDLVGLILTSSTRVPIGTVLRFANATDVATYFGSVSVEAGLATTYFAGYTGATITPASLLFAQYPTAAVPAYLRGGPSGLSLTALQALTPGTITLTVDGRSVTSGTITLSGATSMSNAATLIQTALADKDASFTGVIAVTTGILTASAVTGTIAIGQTISGAGVPAGTVIVSQTGGTTGGAGTYQTNIVTAVSSTAMTSGNTLVTYDSVSGSFVVTAGTPGATGAISFASSALATSLALTAATGAVTSQGSAIGVPGTAMDAVVATTQDFVSFMTTFEPSLSDATAFALWVNGKSNRYLYVSWDTDTAPTLANDTTSLGYVIRTAGYSGTALIFEPTDGANKAAAVMGFVASLDYARPGARATLAFRTQAGLLPGVTDATTASNLKANGYNFFGRYATANAQFTFFYPGQVSGPFAWIDSFVNEVQFNNACQLALVNLLTGVGSIPYNRSGYVLIEAALADPINNAVSYGSIRAGVTLSALQAAEVNAAAGRKIDDVLTQRGWYVLVQDATPAVRAARGSPPVNIWYTDGQSVQALTVPSVLIA